MLSMFDVQRLNVERSSYISCKIICIVGNANAEMKTLARSNGEPISDFFFLGKDSLTSYIIFVNRWYEFHLYRWMMFISIAIPMNQYFRLVLQTCRFKEQTE